MKPFTIRAPLLAGAVAVSLLGATCAPAVLRAAPREPGPATIRVQYGASYYNEYLPAGLRSGRLAIDIALMKKAGVTVVRMGESSWSLWEPADGKFDYAWIDRVVDALGKAGIKVILGTPTYSMPVWLAKAHPEFYARPLKGGSVGYGMRQNMDYDNPLFRRYARQLIVNLVRHYRDNSTVIGWQIDNETGPNNVSNDDVFAEFVTYLKKKFGTPEAMNRAWFLNYWGQDVYDWANMPRPDFATNPSYKLEWQRFQRLRVTRYLQWQAMLVRQNRRPDQFVLHDFASAMRNDVDEEAIAPFLDVVGINIYHGTEDAMDGQWQAMQGDYARSLERTNFFVTETSAQTIGWDSSGQFPPYDGQLRLDLYGNIASGANMQLYWHWNSLHAGLETYWKGVIGHDLEPGRAYREVARTGHELDRIGSALANLQVHNRVAILYSVDSNDALSIMPYSDQGFKGTWTAGTSYGGYARTVQQLHGALYRADVGVDFVFPDTPDFDRYDLLVVPSLYIADDALLRRIDDYVKRGGHVLMTFKSGVANEDSAIRWTRAPGPLIPAAGFTYQEASSLKHPIALRDDPFHVGAGADKTRFWAEFLQLGTAKALAWYDDPFLGRWPAITRNHYGRGTLTYEGAALTDTLQDAVMLDVLKDSGIIADAHPRPAHVRTRNAVAADGQPLHFIMNYSPQPVTVSYAFGAAHDLLTDEPLRPGQQLTIGPWNLVVAEERAAASVDVHKADATGTFPPNSGHN